MWSDGILSLSLALALIFVGVRALTPSAWTAGPPKSGRCYNQLGD